MALHAVWLSTSAPIGDAGSTKRLDVFTISDADSTQRLNDDDSVFCSNMQHFVLEHDPFPFLCKSTAASSPSTDYRYRLSRSVPARSIRVWTPYAYGGRGGELSDLLQLPSGDMMAFDDRTVRGW